ncbi:Uncharacterised protein [Vibrio cholerae]|nr:Uncharacterised protein [Vibrio cholerae]CSC39894.1 Uncharacterised protein [Vibrio cholerae]
MACHFAADYVIGRNVAHYLTTARATVKRQHWDLGAVRDTNRVRNRIRISRVDQNRFHAAHSKVFHVRKLFAWVILRVQHNQVVAKFFGFRFGSILHGHEKRVVQR